MFTAVCDRHNRNLAPTETSVEDRSLQPTETDVFEVRTHLWTHVDVLGSIFITWALFKVLLTRGYTNAK